MILLIVANFLSQERGHSCLRNRRASDAIRFATIHTVPHKILRLANALAVTANF